MKTVKHYCNNCGQAEEYTRKEKIIMFIEKSIASTLLALGVLFLILLIVVGPIPTANLVSSSIMVKFATADYGTNELRHLGINWTSHCAPDVLCYAEGVFEGIKDVRYVPASKLYPIQSPEETYKWGGDCKNTAILYTSVMQNLGWDTMVLCSTSFEHCVSKVPVDENTYIIVDMTIPAMFKMNSTQDAWTYYEDGEMIQIEIVGGNENGI